ncbi:MAG: ketoacyl-ACP synthase III [Bacteroidota bacterium]
MGAKINAIEYFFPEKLVTNDDLKLEFPDHDFSKFEQKIGIRNRYIAGDSETALDLAVKSCEKLFKEHDKSEIDYVLYCTQSPEYFLPTTACILQHKLGLRKNIGAFDFNLGCSGYTYGVSLAKSLINSNQAKHVLLVTAETYSKYLHPKDKSNRAIFGDAASSTIISYSEEENIGNFLFGTDGSGFDKLIVRNGAARYDFNPAEEELVYGSDNVYSNNHLYMNGPEIFNFTNQVIPGFTNEILTANNLEKGDIDQFIFHQANAFMLNTIRKTAGIEASKFFIDLMDGGNTVSCTIPIALKKYLDKRASTHKEKIVIVGFGVGLSWSGGLLEL